MKKQIITAIILLSTLGAKAQLPSLDFVYGFTNDARLLLEEYMRPYANVMGANLNAGWYNTAKPHKLGGFDITASVSIAYAPTSSLSYDLASLTDLRASVEGTTTVAPTIAGQAAARPTLIYDQTVTNPTTGLPETFELARVTHPDGSGLNFLPMPMAQLSVGLIKGTDVTLRFIPNIEIGSYGDLGLFGIGAKHSISQWIPVLNKLKFINIAVQGGYTKVSMNANLDMQPIADVGISNPPEFDDQFFTMDVSGWTVNIIASQSIPLLTVYQGIGYSSSLVDAALLGTYPINTIVTQQGADFGKTTYTVVEDPIPDLSIANNNNLRLNAGVRLKLGVLTLHYDFTRTLYTTHSAGIGITFR